MEEEALRLTLQLAGAGDVWDPIDWRSQWEELQAEAGLMPATSQQPK